MQKDDVVYLGHILDLSGKVLEKIGSMSRDDFNRSEDLQIAVTHLIQNIGEAARRVSHEFQSSHSEIPWSEIIGMRHKIVHDYIDVDYDIVWDVAVAELPRIFKLIELHVPSDQR